MSEIVDICRVCRNIDTYKNIFDTELIPEIIYNLANVKVIKDDRLPQHICEICHQKLLDFHEFRTVIILSNKEHKEKLSKSSENDDSLGIKVETAEEDANDDNQKCLSEFVEVKIEDDLLESRNDGDSDKKKSSRKSKKIKNKIPKKKISPNANTAIVCELCGKKSFTQQRHEGHLRTHKGLNPAVCQECGKDFLKWKNLAYHVQAVHGEEKYICEYPECGKKYSIKSSFDKHRNVHEKTEHCVCDECGAVISNKSNLQKHMLTHTQQKPRPKIFACEQCPKVYATMNMLKHHKMNHDGIKKYECNVCGLKKKTSTELKIHMNHHSREKLFDCRFCGKEYPTKGSMNTHVNVVHLGVKRYVCDFCSKSFGKSDTLKHHRMTHTGERPHKCNMCGKGFIQVVALKSHLSTHVK